MRVPKIHLLEAAALTLLFAIAISLPLARLLTIGEPDISALEKRQLAPVPDLTHNWKMDIKLVDSYVRDHFGFRSLLVRLNAKLYSRWLHISNWAVIGSNGWLFYKNIPPLFSGRLSSEDLATWKSYLEHRQRWLAARGVKYLFVVAPDKESVYQEFLPVTSRPRPRELPADQLVRYLRETSSTVDVIYLREPLLAAKKLEQEPLYYKQDGHWNSLGAFYGYEAIMRRMAGWFPAMKAKTRADYSLAFAKDGMRDIAIQAGLWDTPPLLGPVLQPLTPTSTTREDKPLPRFPMPPFMTSMPEPSSLPRAVMLRDSFTIGLAPYLSESFSRITYFWPSLFLSIRPEQEEVFAKAILKEKADIFIEEHVERMLINRPNEEIIFGGNP